MNDKELLDRIRIAYKVYPYPSKELEVFINWLYKQYGMIPPEKLDGQS